jgi:regulator of RNase E activity RraB
MRFLATALVLCILFGCTGETMKTEQSVDEDRWEFFPCSMGDNQAFIFLNVSIAERMSDVPSQLAKLKLVYKSPNPNGLPTNEEFVAVSAIEDRITSFAEEASDWYVGRVTVGGVRFFYVYTGRNESSWSDFVSLLTEETGYDIRFSHKNDPEHKGYFDDLYPTKDDWQVISDLKVIEALEKHGDDGSAIRKIEHWVYFDDMASASEFEAWAEADRFKKDNELSSITEDGKYCVRLYHQGTVELGDISNHTIALSRKASEHGGDYDGWETEVTKPEDNKANSADTKSRAAD